MKMTTKKGEEVGTVRRVGLSWEISCPGDHVSLVYLDPTGADFHSDSDLEIYTLQSNIRNQTIQ